MIHDLQAISRQYLAARYDNRPVSHRLKTEPKLFLFLSPWVWWTASALAFAAWGHLALQGY